MSHLTLLPPAGYVPPTDPPPPESGPQVAHAVLVAHLRAVEARLVEALAVARKGRMTVNAARVEAALEYVRGTVGAIGEGRAR